MAESQELNTTPEPPGSLNLREAADTIGSMDVDALFGDDRPSNREQTQGESEDVDPDAEHPDTQDSAEDEDTDEELKQRSPDNDEEVDEGENDTEDSAEQTDTDDDTDDSEEPEIIQTVEQLAEAWDTPLEQVLEALTVTTPGQDDPVNLKELRDGYLRQSDYTKSKQQLAEDRTGFDAEIGEARQGNERNNAVMATLFQQMQQAYLSPPDAAAMEQLRTEDPAEWAAQRQGFMDRQGFFQQILQGAATNYDQQQTEYANTAQQQFGTFVEGEKTKLLQAVPEWNEESRTSLWSFVGPQYGFSEDEIRATIDSRTIRIALDAQKWHQSQATGKKAKKKLQDVPKIVKANTKKARSKGQLNADNIRKLRAKSKSSGKVGDAARVLEATLGEELL